VGWLELFLDNYTGIYNRSSEAACRVGLDLLLCECIGALVSWLHSSLVILLKHKRLQQGKVSAISPTQPTRDGQHTPTPWDSVQVHCELSFTHPINHIPTFEDIVVGGRVDHGVGIIIKSRRKKAPNRLFHSLLLCAEAKFDGRLSDALSQLIVYLASLRQSRVNRGRSDTSVYGIATDGLCYIFVTITHQGVIKKSKQFDLMHGALSTVLGCLKYILETAMSMTSTSMAEKGVSKASDELQDDADDLFDLSDTPYTQPNDEEF